MTRLISTVVVVAMALSLSAPAWAADITVTDAWSRASAGMARAGAGFMQITNSGAADDRLIAASAPVSDKTELHTHIQEGTVMRMRQVEAIEVPAGQSVTLKPGGLHIMFITLKEPLQEGQTFEVALEFEKAGTVTVPIQVQGPGSMGGMGGMGAGGGMKHGH